MTQRTSWLLLINMKTTFSLDKSQQKLSEEDYFLNSSMSPRSEDDWDLALHILMLRVVNDWLKRICPLVLEGLPLGKTAAFIPAWIQHQLRK